MAIASLNQDTAAYQRPPVVPKQPASLEAMASRDSSDWERYEAPETEMSFWDFLDVINPLQHIPGINTAYRHLTGDTITPSARVMGGMLYGGPVGGMAAIANAVIEQRDGQDIGDQLYAALGLGGEPTGDEGSVAVAAAPDPRSPALTGGQQPAADVAASPAALPAAPVEAQIPPTLAAQLAHKREAVAPPAAGKPVDTPITVAALESRLTDGTSPPSRMPSRDTPLASSSLARYGNSGPTVPASATTGVTTRSMNSANLLTGLVAQEVADSKPGADAPAQAQTVSPATVPAFGTPVPTEVLSDVMLRNLSKYENGRRAAQQPADAKPGVRLSS